MKATQAVDRETFEKFFRRMNASWGFEGAALNERQKELLYRRITGDLSDQEYMKQFMQHE